MKEYNLMISHVMPYLLSVWWMWLSRLREAMSVLLGLLDQLAAYATVKRNAFFRHGTGDVANFRRILGAISATKHRQAKDVHLGAWTVNNGVALANGSFKSPVSDFLPDEPAIRQVNFQLVAPAQDVVDGAIPRGIPWAVHLPATGDEGFSARRKFLASPLQQRGVGSVLLQIPFYGKRRLLGQKGYFLNSIENFGQQSLGAVTEASAIASWLREQSSGPVVFTGISYGGAMAALTSAMTDIDHATVTMVPSHSPAPPFVEGKLASSVAFGAFSGGRGEVAQLLSEMDVVQVLDQHRTSGNVADSKRVYIQLTARHDAYVPYHSGVTLSKAMRGAKGTVASELHLLPGGHVSAVMFNRDRYQDAILKGIELLEAELGTANQEQVA